MKFKILISAFFIICILLLQYDKSFTNSLAPPTQKTGSALSSGTCSSCHSGGAGSGSIAYVFYYAGTTVQATQYVPGCVYDVSVNVSGTGNSTPRYGFEIDAVDASNNGAGTFTLTHPNSDPVHTQVNTLGTNGACEVSHKSATTTTDTWFFQWTAPLTNVGNITFSLAGVYGDGSGSGGDDVATTTFFITPGSVAPVANFHILPNDTVCVGTQVSFVDSATSNGAVIIAAGYNYGTGQGNSGIFTSVQPTVNKTYTTAGTYQVVYTLSTVNPVTNMPCTYSTKVRTITVINYPDASFVATGKPGCPGGRDTLKLSNPVAGVTYTPGYSTATQLTPLSAQGPYPLTLPTSLGNVTFSMTATGFGCTSPPMYDIVQVQVCAPPTAGFNVAKFHTDSLSSSYCHNTYYTINDHSTSSGGNIINWQWKLRGVAIHPQPANYNGKGPFDVFFPIASIDTITLIVTDSRGLMDTSSSLITINGCGPNIMHAMYNAQPTAAVITGLGTSTLNTCINDTLNYVDKSSGVITGYRWIWGDGTADSFGVNVTHAYSTPGVYTMKYIVDSANVKYDTNFTTVTVGIVSNAYAGRDTAICPSSAGVTLGGASTSGMNYTWTTSNLNFVPPVSNPVVTPSVTTTYYLRVSNTLGTCNSFDTVVVIVDTIPIFNITASNDSVCFNNQILISTNATGLKNYLYSFGSGFSSSGSGAGPYLVSWGQPGFKCITATAKTKKAGCAVSSAAMNPCVLVRNCTSPKPSFLPPIGPICTGNSITFTDATQNSPTSWSWKFISPDTANHPALPAASSLQNPTTTVPIAGKYFITLSASNSGGTSAIYLDSIWVFPTPTANFDYIDTVCIGHNTIILYNGNAGTTATYNWTYNPAPAATSGGLQGPVYANWSSVGTKAINLQVIEFGCPSLPISKNIIITALPTAHFTFNNIGPNYSFVNQSSGSPTSFFWSFGDGQTSSTQHPIHSYNNNGDYIVTLTVTKNGCSDDDTVTIHAIVNGIDDAIENKLFNAYHNSVNSTLNVNWINNNSSEIKVEIININGQIIYTENNKSSKNISISTLAFSKGIYAVRCIDEHGASAIKKWIKD